MQKFFIFMVSNLVLLSSCYGNESDPRQRKIRRAVEFVGTEFQPGPDCVFKGSVSMPAQDLEPLGGETGGVEADFFHDLMGKALRMEAPYRGLFPSPPLFDRMPTYRTQGKRSLNFLSATMQSLSDYGKARGANPKSWNSDPPTADRKFNAPFSVR
jgi:hypothetical protein